MNQIEDKVQKIGLSDNESRIYSVLIEKGGAYPSKIAEITKINRSTVYKTLTELTIKGLINEIERKSKLFYQIERPDNIVRYLKNKISLAEDDLRKAEQILPELKFIFSQTTNRPRVLFFEGEDTVQRLCDDMISANKKYEMLAFSNAKSFKRFMPTEKLREFIKAKEKINIKTRAIVPDTKEDRTYSETVFQNIKKSIWPEVRYVSPEMFPFEAEITMYGDRKVSITKLSKENLIGVLIEDETIYKTMKMIFEIAWESRVLRD